MKAIQRTKVSSAYLNSVGYDTNTATLEIEFKPDYVVFQYFNVPYSVYKNLMSSSSMGGFFHKHIKHRYLEEQII